MNFGNYLTELRKKNNLSMSELSNLSGLSVSQISRIESGKRGVPKPNTLKIISPHLKVSYDELMIAAGHIKVSGDLDDWITEIVTAMPQKKEAIKLVWNIIKGL